MEKSSVKDIVIAITYQCNSRCRMCGIWRKNQVGILNATDFAKLPVNLSNINLTGGEPFLRSDLTQIVSVIKKTCPGARVVISTNGFATDLIINQIKNIKTFMPNIGVAVSLDGIGKVHDEIRSVLGGFNMAMHTIKELKRIGIKNLRLAFTLGDYNISELTKVYELSRQLDIEMTLAAVHSSKNYFEAENKITKKQEMAETLDWLIEQELNSLSLKRWLRAYFAYGLKKFILTGRRILPDYSGKYNLFIDPFGKIYPNDISDHQIGSLSQGFYHLADADKPASQSWMICTARWAIRKHWLKFIFWLIGSKFSLNGNL